MQSNTLQPVSKSALIVYSSLRVWEGYPALALVSSLGCLSAPPPAGCAIYYCYLVAGVKPPGLFTVALVYSYL